MTKTFCDFCGKESPRDEFKTIAIINNPWDEAKEEYYDICKKCLDEIYKKIGDSKEW